MIDEVTEDFYKVFVDYSLDDRLLILIHLASLIRDREYHSPFELESLL